MPSIRTILVPTDFSPPAAEAFRQAHALARATGARVVVLHVARPPAVVVDGGRLSTDPTGGGLDDLWADLRKLEAEDPSVVVEHEVIVADRPDVSHVLNIVEASECDLIVMGTHGLTGLKHRLFGGLTEDIVRLAHCPVMVVKTRADEGSAQGPEVISRAIVSKPEDTPAEPVLQSAFSEPDAALHGEYLG
jgi:nucleotide-binding universal stress UspA family protein